MQSQRKKRRAASTIQQWRTDKSLVKAASLTMQNEVLQEMLAVVENASPLNGNQLAFGAHISEGDHSRHLGRIEGYSMCLRALESLGQLVSLPKEPKVTYSAPEE